LNNGKWDGSLFQLSKVGRENHPIFHSCQTSKSMI
jgi:hypothetical protein